MGVSHSRIRTHKKRQQQLQIIDFGSIIPLGLYNKNDEYDLNLVRELIVSKKISPFYKGLSSPFEELSTTNNDEKMTSVTNQQESDTTAIVSVMNKDRKKKRLITKKKQPQQLRKEEDDYILYLYENEQKLQNTLYNNSVECPICFLYYPANINFARCCDQPICTECFVQIKKGPADYHTTSSSSNNCSNIVCPYCMTEDFGIIYQSPSSSPSSTILLNDEKSYQVVSTTSGLSENQNSKRKSIESSHPDVVLIDHVRAQQHQKVIMTSGNTRLINSRRALQFLYQQPASRNATSLERYLATIRLDDNMGLEDIMVIESIRQSLIDREQHVY